MSSGIWFIMLAVMLASFVIQRVLSSKFEKYSGIPSPGGLTGADVARLMLAQHGITDVTVQSVSGKLTDHYNPKDKTVNLSEGVFDDISDRELYEAVNVARPSLIRTEADELSYCLHILIRYEIEKLMMNGEISVDQVPALWNAKYKEYLGVDVPDDTRGCLQDVHWSGYAFGYFPSYALGNAYGVQILNTMKKDFDVDAAVRAGDLLKIRDWLIEHVFSIASLTTPDEWIRAITGESLNVDYYLDYLEEKFTKLYELKTAQF